MIKKFLFLISAELLLFSIFQLIIFLVPADSIIYNSNFFFGIFDSNNLAIAILFVALVAIILIQKISTDRIALASSVFLFSGILSNIFDRIFRGGVLDYISIAHWPTFDLPDVFIVLGIIIFGIRFLQHRPNHISYQ